MVAQGFEIMAFNKLRRVKRRLYNLLNRQGAVRTAGSAEIRFTGDYASWDDARRECCGYDAVHIADRVLQTTLDVLEGRFAWERDSVGFANPEYNWPLLSCLLHIAASNGGRLRVVDFGGALGSTFLQHRVFFKGLTSVDWQVVEQDSFVARGRSAVAGHPDTAGLSFYGSVDDALQAGEPDVLLLGSVLQYLENPLVELQRLLSSNFRFVLLDRTAILRGDARCLLTVQHVPATIYEARYPAWFLGCDLLMQVFSKEYMCMVEWCCSDSYDATRGRAAFIGCCFRRIAEGAL